MITERFCELVPKLARWLLIVAALLTVASLGLVIADGPVRVAAGAAIGCLLAGLILRAATWDGA